MQTLTSRHQPPDVLENEDIQIGKSDSYFWAFCLVTSVIVCVALVLSERRDEDTGVLNDAGKLLSICQKYASDHKGMLPLKLDDLVSEGYLKDEALIYHQSKWGEKASRWIYHMSPQTPASESSILFASADAVNGKAVVVFSSGKIVELAAPAPDAVSRAQVWPRHIFDH